MTVTIDDIEDFMSHFHDQNIGKLEDKNLRKAIRHYWNVASEVTVDSRIETVKGEGWIKKNKTGNTWELKSEEEREDGIEQLFED